jgi:hypothetical protein
MEDGVGPHGSLAQPGGIDPLPLGSCQNRCHGIGKQIDEVFERLMSRSFERFQIRKTRIFNRKDNQPTAMVDLTGEIPSAE